MSKACLTRPLTIRAAWFAALFAGFGQIGLGQAAQAAPIAPDGLWYTKDNESIIKVEPCTKEAQTYCGTVVWLKQPKESDGSPKLDKLDPDPAKKNHPILGLTILLDMTAEDDHWSGKAYNPDDGKFYSITFHVKTDKVANDSADLRGCVLGFLCQTETFTRTAAVPGDLKKRKNARKDPTAKGAGPKSAGTNSSAADTRPEPNAH